MRDLGSRRRKQLPKAIFTDMDGTITDSIPLLYAAYEQLMHSFGSQPSWEEFYELAGPPLPNALEQLLVRYGWKANLRQLLLQHQQFLESHYVQAVALQPGVRFFIEEAVAPRAIPLVLVTSASIGVAKPLLERLGLLSFFVELICAEDVLRGKPHPEPYLTGLSRLAIDPEEAIAIEDSPLGVASSTSAGLFTYWLDGKLSGGAPTTPGRQLHRISGWDELARLLFER